MYCNRCGKEIEPGWKHCRYCGAPIVASRNTKRPRGKRRKEKSGSGRSNGRTWLVAAFVLLLVITTIGGLKYFHNEPTDDVRETPKVDSTAEIELPRLDAKTYFEERSEIVRVIDAMESETVPTEKQATEELAARGFDTFPLMTDYTMDGIFCSDTQTSSESEEKHPVYTTYYASLSGEYWTIYNINGTIIAYPISYNLQSTHSTKLVISEFDTIMCYDNQESKFYEVIPNKNILIIKKINRIDSENLDKLTSEAINAL